MLQGSSKIILSAHDFYHPAFHLGDMGAESISVKLKLVGGAATKFIDGGLETCVPVLQPSVVIFELFVPGGESLAPALQSVLVSGLGTGPRQSEDRMWCVLPGLTWQCCPAAP